MVRDRKGFTLVEMLIVSVLGSLLLIATYQVLITNQRTYAVQSVKIREQQVGRVSLDVLFNELREVSAGGGDILGMGADTLRVRAMRRYGLVCAPPVVSGISANLTVLRAGDFFEKDDSAFVFAENSETTVTDDAWIPAVVSAVDTTQVCGTQAAQRLTFSDSAFVRNVVRAGAPVRSFTDYKYGVFEYGGKYYLGRQERSGDKVPMVGPLDATRGGVRFRYLDSLGAVTSQPMNVRQIQVSVRTWADVTTTQGTQVADTATITIYPRN